MAQINVKGVTKEMKEALESLAVALATTETAIIKKAIQDFIDVHRGDVQKGRQTIESSPMRKE
jgi:predicted transcriptional regulator